MMMSESWSDDERREDGGSSLTSEETCCFIEQLPYEVLEIIFAHVPDQHMLRVVCKRWWDILSQDQTLIFKRFVCADTLEKCTFRSFGLQFHDLSLNKLPPSVWEKIGCRVHSVELDSCKLGDQGLKNLIVHCDNLQSLRVVLKRKGDADVFCSPNMLKELNITRKNLETFEIFNRRRTVDVSEWIQIFEALFKVYPKLGNNDFNGIVSSLAFSLSTKDSHRRQALNASSTLRLFNVSLHYTKSHHIIKGDHITLSKIFKEQKYLKRIKLELSNWSIPNDVLEFLLLEILECCPNLQKLLIPLKVTDPNWLLALRETTFVQFCTKLTGLKEVSLNRKSLLIKGSSLTCRDIHFVHRDKLRLVNKTFGFNFHFTRKGREETCSPSWGLILQKFMMTHCDLLHLDLEYFPCPDEILQNIFKYLVHLKTLSVCVTKYNTCSGITGRPENVPDDCKYLVEPYQNPYESSDLPAYLQNFLNSASDGYSINRLKYLEKLTIDGLADTKMKDTIFDEFVLPRLRYLKIKPPNDIEKFLAITTENMPLLETIVFIEWELERKQLGVLRVDVTYPCSYPSLRIIREYDRHPLSENEKWF